LGEDDKRILYITFVGWLATSVGLVLIVGLGLAVTHLIHRYQPVLGSVVVAIVVQVGGTVIALVRSTLYTAPITCGRSCQPFTIASLVVIEARHIRPRVASAWGTTVA
jgi:hypothetical protein